MASKCSFCNKPCSHKCICGDVFYCSDECQKYDWINHKETCPLVSIRYVDEERGRGLLANRRIHPGQLILEEAPVMLIGSDMQQDHQKEIIYQYNRLTKHQKKIYNCLSYNKLLKGPGNLVKILNIWYTNNVCSKNSKFDEEDVKGMYFRFSMSVNHSCIPNCVLNFDEDRNLKLVAIARIAKGEELVINYLDPSKGEKNLLRYERQKSLIKGWNFVCKCPVCSLTGQALSKNEALKRDLASLVEEQENSSGVNVTENTRKRLTLEVEIAGILQKLGPETVRELPYSLHRCYLYSKILQIQGVSLSQSPESFRNAALEGSRLLGETFVQRFSHVDQEMDAIISSVLRSVVASRRKIFYNLPANATIIVANKFSN